MRPTAAHWVIISGATPPESTVAYKDADWEDIFLPHDALIASAPSEKARLAVGGEAIQTPRTAFQS